MRVVCIAVRLCMHMTKLNFNVSGPCLDSDIFELVIELLFRVNHPVHCGHDRLATRGSKASIQFPTRSLVVLIIRYGSRCRLPFSSDYIIQNIVYISFLYLQSFVSALKLRLPCTTIRWTASRVAGKSLGQDWVHSGSPAKACVDVSI